MRKRLFWLLLQGSLFHVIILPCHVLFGSTACLFNVKTLFVLFHANSSEFVSITAKNKLVFCKMIQELLPLRRFAFSRLPLPLF
jgi:Zn-dependent membrane protease YugP